MSTSVDRTDIKKRQGLKVRAMLVERGITITAIAKRLNLTHGTVSAVVRGLRKSKRVKAEVARVLGVDTEALWPNNHNNKKAA